MADAIAQIFALTFVGTILICLVWTVLEYIFNTGSMLHRRSENNKLLENLDKLDKTKGKKK